VRHCHQQGQFARLAGGFCSRSTCEHRPWTNVLGALGPRLGRTVRIGATPATHQPDQSRRAPEAGQIPGVDPEPVLGHRSHSRNPGIRRSRPSSRPSRSLRRTSLPHRVLKVRRVPTAASARPVTSSIVRDPPRWVVEQPQRCRVPWPRSRIPRYVTLPTSTRRAA
jgi:hypothetical protein